MADGNGANIGELIERARQGDAECRDRLFELCRVYLGFAARAQVESIFFADRFALPTDAI